MSIAIIIANFLYYLTKISIFFYHWNIINVFSRLVFISTFFILF